MEMRPRTRVILGLIIMVGFGLGGVYFNLTRHYRPTAEQLFRRIAADPIPGSVRELRKYVEWAGMGDHLFVLHFRISDGDKKAILEKGFRPFSGDESSVTSDEPSANSIDDLLGWTYKGDPAFPRLSSNQERYYRKMAEEREHYILYDRNDRSMIYMEYRW